MYIHDFNIKWMDNPFWKKSLKINSDIDLKKLRNSRVKAIVIDTQKGCDVLEVAPEEAPQEVEADTETIPMQPDSPEAPVISTNISSNQSRQPTSAKQERQFAKRVIAESKEAVVSMFNDARMGNAVNTEDAMPIVEELTASVSRNQSALVSLVRLKTQDDYTYLHSVAVCALMVALAKELNLSEEETKQAGLAGLLHDIGKSAIPEEILNKPDKLTDEEFEIVKSHPDQGYQMLVQANVTEQAALDVSLHHHEKIDGSGYPEKLTSDELSIFAKMGAVCDVYDAVTSDRVYKLGWEPGLALQRMATWENHFDTVIFKAFVRSVGIYPVGALVKLSSGYLAVVVEQSKTSLLTPIVKLIYHIGDSLLIQPELVDLSADAIKDKIMTQEDPKGWGIRNINQYWNED